MKIIECHNEGMKLSSCYILFPTHPKSEISKLATVPLRRGVLVLFVLTIALTSLKGSHDLSIKTGNPVFVLNDSIEIAIKPATVLVEEGSTAQNLNFDFIITNLSTKKLIIREIEVSLFPHLHYELRNGTGAKNVEGLPSRFTRFYKVMGSRKFRIKKGVVNSGDVLETN